MNKFKLALYSGIFLGCSTVNASGFRVPEISTAGLSLSNAVVANPNEPGAMAYNPAIMGLYDNISLAVGMTKLKFNLEVTPSGGTLTENVGKSSFQIPNLFYALDIKNNLRFGLALNAPFGLETKWPDETFPQFAGALDPAEPALSKIKMINLNPNISYSLSSDVSIGVMHYQLLDLNFNTQVLPISGTGDDYGFNLGYIHRFGDTTFGVSYRSSVKVPVSGTYGASTPVTAEIEFPSMLQLGINYQLNDKWNLEFDYDQTNWSSFDRLEIKNANTGATLVTSDNYWKDTEAYRFGATSW